MSWKNKKSIHTFKLKNSKEKMKNFLKKIIRLIFQKSPILSLFQQIKNLNCKSKINKNLLKKFNVINRKFIINLNKLNIMKMKEILILEN